MLALVVVRLITGSTVSKMMAYSSLSPSLALPAASATEASFRRTVTAPCPEGLMVSVYSVRETAASSALLKAPPKEKLLRPRPKTSSLNWAVTSKGSLAVALYCVASEDESSTEGGVTS